MFLQGCSYEDNSANQAKIDEMEITSALSDINVTRSNNKIVDHVSIEDSNQIFALTDQTVLTIPNRIIQDIAEDFSNWRITIFFKDGRSSVLYLKGTSTGISSDDVILNPYEVAPLTAEVIFTTPVPGSIKVAIPGRGENGIGIEKHFADVNTQFSFPILGLYEDYANPVEFHFFDADGNLLVTDVVNIITETIENLPQFNILVNNLPESEIKVYMDITKKYAFDQNGDVRWAYVDNDIERMFDRLPNGNWIASDNIGLIYYYWTGFVEMSMLGEVVEEYSLSNYGHHEIRCMNNGNYLVGTNSVAIMANENTLREDALTEISASTHQVEAFYDLNQILDHNRDRLPGTPEHDWFHLNAAYHDATDDSIVISGRNQSAVVKIDRATGDLIWILSPHEGWSAKFEPYLLTPVDSNGNPLNISDINFWPYAQHAPVRLNNGNILIYDNGNNRGHYKEIPKAENQYSRAVEYKIDKALMTIEKVWEFDYQKTIFTPITGDVDYLPDWTYYRTGCAG